MAALKRRDWVPSHCEALVGRIAGETATAGSDAIADRIEQLARANRVTCPPQNPSP